ncbi:PhzF family phenazine biosynthesis protein [Clostridium magnum]|uniref:Putative isomerase YddE n=1 Tax=Clostridium magnum DSM 2767 TaxID=1121326 RepID=A0A161X3T4_9CLOT|nr:PhzF family phenazine biosynthesis isomerase [Clostridium magnum]KZL88466.1 putative isomerase YddE [Clostridium magnum DSM 2767]SHI90392.1 phenazine biosynthesis protein PhzF family [Clostridium magnum DSM 2767]
MKKYGYKKIDAFTSNKSLGNPAACIYLKENENLSHSKMLNIAKEHKGFVSEFVFCSSSLEADCKLTYYSSECEVDFCGHGTIACMYDLIKNTESLLFKSEILMDTNKKGILTVYNELRDQDAVYITAPKPIYIGTNITAKEAAENLGISVESISDKYPIDLINAGLPTLIVPISNLKDEINIFPDIKKLEEFCNNNGMDIILIYSTEVKDNKNIAHTRVFSPKFGYLEDPATGSGNSAFAYYMLKNNMWDGNPVSIEQGGIDRIFNIVKLATKGSNVIFGGSATVKISGEYYL